tara:strand:+ start:215 stop:355 length:141 start_codon:yes stop_codon:yes gene_type:complete
MNENIILPSQGKGNLMFVKKKFQAERIFFKKFQNNCLNVLIRFLKE